MERAEGKGCRKDGIVYWWHGAKIWKKEINPCVAWCWATCLLPSQQGLPVQEEFHL